MDIKANIYPTTGSPQLSPRTAHAVQAAKAKAERAVPAVTETQLSDALQKVFGLTLPQSLNSRVELNVDKETGLVIGKIVDRMTGEVIRQLPPEEMVRLLEATKEALGPLVDFTA
jgi:flagellar protein FlaG